MAGGLEYLRAISKGFNWLTDLLEMQIRSWSMQSDGEYVVCTMKWIGGRFASEKKDLVEIMMFWNSILILEYFMRSVGAARYPHEYKDMFMEIELAGCPACVWGYVVAEWINRSVISRS